MSPAAEETIARLKEQAEEEAATDEPVASEDEVESPVLDAEEEDAPKSKVDTTREYVILKAWEEIGRVVAGSGEAAVKSLPETALKDGAKYVTVPVRNWGEHEIAVETKTTISIK